MSSKSFWADLSQVEIVRTPRTVLLEQAQYLTKAMKGTLVGGVSNLRDVAASTFHYELYIQVPALNHYLVTILRIDHDIELYPVRLTASRPTTDVYCASESEFERAVESVLSSREVTTMLSRLKSQVT